MPGLDAVFDGVVTVTLGIGGMIIGAYVVLVTVNFIIRMMVLGGVRK